MNEKNSAALSAAQLATVVEQSDDAIISLDLEGRVLSWNRGARRLLGYGEEEMRGVPFTRISPSDGGVGLAEALSHLGSEGSLARTESEWRRRDGSSVPVSVRLSSLTDDAGRVARACLVAREIGEPRPARQYNRMEDAPPEGERFLRRVLDSLFAFVGVLDTDGTLLEANEAPLKVAGLLASDVIGKKFWDCEWWNHSVEAQLELRDAVERAARGQTVRYDALIRVAGDARMWIDFQLAPLRNEEGTITHLIPSGMDLTERKGAEEALRESEGRWRFALEAAHAGAWELDLQDHSAWRSLRHDEIFGYREGLREWTYERFLEHVLEDERDKVHAVFQRALASGEDLSFECRIRRTDAEIRWIRVNGRTHGRFGESRRLMWGIVEDVTERERAEQTLRERTDLLRGVAESTPDLIFAKDRRCRMLLANPATLEVIGKPAAEVLGHSDDEWHHDLDQAVSIMANDRRIMESGKVATVEEVFTTPGGETRLFSSSKNPLRDASGATIGIVSVTRDVTALKQVEAALRESEERHRVALEGGALGTWTYDAARAEATLDARAREIFGFSVEERPDLVGAASVFHPEDRPRALAEIRRALKHGGRYEVEMRVAIRDDEIRWIRTWGVVRRVGDEPSSAMLVGVVQDVTGQKRAEHALEEASRRKDDYLAMLSHELRNPLAAIRTAGQLVKHYSSAAPVLDRASGVLERQSSHMAKLLDGLLDVSRITRGKVTVDKRVVELESLIEDLLADRRAEAQTKGVRLCAELGGNKKIFVNADPSRLTQVFDNLLGNALKFTEPGGTVTVSTAVEAGQAVVIVRDTGVGFSREFAEQLFEPFVQGPQDMSRKSGGLGLGLALARGLLQLHDGTIDGHSRGEGRGAEFEVRLPVLPRTESRSEAVQERLQSGVDRLSDS